MRKIQSAAKSGQLLSTTVENISAWLSAGLPPWVAASIEELIAKQAWSELNDRFYRYLEFGTGGMRGRTIGAVSTAAEVGRPGPFDRPEHPAVGSNMLNEFTLIRATIGLARYTRKYLAAQGNDAAPALVIAHDVRHFSRDFCELAASAWTRLGGVAFIFDGPRSTPQLSFSVRYLKAHAGVVVTASHNPPHDNGFKAYFEGGGQVVPPHDGRHCAGSQRGATGRVGAVFGQGPHAGDFARPSGRRRLSGGRGASGHLSRRLQAAQAEGGFHESARHGRRLFDSAAAARRVRGVRSRIAACVRSAVSDREIAQSRECCGAGGGDRTRRVAGTATSC